MNYLTDLSKWSFLWESGDYCLYFKSEEYKRDLWRGIIYDKKGGSIRRIEDDDLATEIKKKMVDAGVEIRVGIPDSQNVMTLVMARLDRESLSKVDHVQIYNEMRQLRKDGKPDLEVMKTLEVLLTARKKVGES